MSLVKVIRPESSGSDHLYKEQGNPNLTGAGFDFPTDPTFGMSRRDMYPDKHYQAWWRKLYDRFVG